MLSGVEPFATGRFQDLPVADNIRERLLRRPEGLNLIVCHMFVSCSYGRSSCFRKDLMPSERNPVPVPGTVP